MLEAIRWALAYYLEKTGERDDEDGADADS
jgi:hypothetical protein